jgi:diguanylate cyclase (GGDEF)-like protein
VGTRVKEVLNLSLIVEPDRQRLVGFAMDAVRALRGNPFAAARVLVSLLPDLRTACEACDGVFVARLVVSGAELRLCWCDHDRLIGRLAESPRAEVLDGLAARLREASESVDAELLMRRNRQITANLGHLEADLDLKRKELQKKQQELQKKQQELQKSIHCAETDGLTGLLNRGAYDGRLREVFLRSRRQREPLSLVLLDLDKFKEVNDSRGHQFGDEYLRRMADAMRAAVREHVDFPCRMGGDEFAIVACAPLRIAERIARQVLEAMDRRVSVGVAGRRADDTIDSLVGRADAALYASKRAGRGKITVDDDSRREMQAGGA